MLKTICGAALCSSSFYFVLLGVLASFPVLQTHTFYLHRVTLTGLKDIAVPEQFGFAPYQVSSFFIDTKENNRLHAWHVVPIGAYRRSFDGLHDSKEKQKDDAQLDLLKSNPAARLVIYFHGTAGSIASGWRPDSYRAIYAAASDHIHVLTFDYRGYGLSSGSPPEHGLLEDGLSVVEWALNVAKIPPWRIVIYGQSLGTAVALALMRHCSALPEPVLFAGHVLTASFSDVATLTATYRIGGLVPVLAPLKTIPPLLAFFNSFLMNTWESKDRLAEYIKSRESLKNDRPYHINLIHAEDDPDINCHHSNLLFWHAVNASSPTGVSYEELHDRKKLSRTNLGPGGWVAEHRTERGLVRQTMLSYGVHDKLMAYPVTSLAVLDAFQAAEPGFMV